MKFTLATLALASVAYSQTIASETAMLPACALTCLTSAITSSGCGLTDYACQCGTQKTAITQAATPCIITGCSTDDALKTQSITAEICVLAAAASSAGTSVSVATSSAASVGSSIASSASSMASSASSAISSHASSVSSAVSSAASSASSRASSASGSATTTAPTTVTTNAASRERAGALVAGLAVFAAIAL